MVKKVVIIIIITTALIAILVFVFIVNYALFLAVCVYSREKS